MKLAIRLGPKEGTGDSNRLAPKQPSFRGDRAKDATKEERRDDYVLHGAVRPGRKAQGHQELRDDKSKRNLRESPQHSNLVLRLEFQPTE